MFGSNFSPLLPNFFSPFFSNALLSPASVCLSPRTYRFASIGWPSRSSRMSSGTESSARERLSDVSRRLFAKDGISRSTSRSRRPARLCGGCSPARRAIERGLSFESLIWDSSWADLRIPRRRRRRRRPPLRWRPPPLLLLRIHPWPRPRPRHRRRRSESPHRSIVSC
jgi:hypothetical protein